MSVQVAGSTLPCSVADFEHRCLTLLEWELERIDSDTAIVSVLCDAVRLCREFVSISRGRAAYPYQPEEAR